jgi:hypothetical protein
VFQYLTETVAACRLAFDEANAAHVAALDKVAGLDGRIARCEARQGAITARRLDDKATPGEAAEYAALNGDLAVLRKLRAEAQAVADVADPAEQRRALAIAENALATHQGEAELDVVVQHARRVEAAYIAALARVWSEARKRGHPRTFGDSYMIDPVIMDLCRLNDPSRLEGK